MSLTIGPAFTIPGYTTVAATASDSGCEATVYAADVVVGHPAFWSHYLAGPLGADREVDAAFEVTAAVRASAASTTVMHGGTAPPE
ncbi:hypothetical protein ABZ749_08420 [Micromonospora sp. NPDC047753]|uniref:hypothetical protein n=1 Tax=Micromonospora sp. NPDC047753 TaxID=3154817 RepID=UPI0033E9250B